MEGKFWSWTCSAADILLVYRGDGELERKRWVQGSYSGDYSELPQPRFGSPQPLITDYMTA